MKTYKELLNDLISLERKIYIYKIALKKIQSVRDAQEIRGDSKNNETFEVVLKPALQSYFQLKNETGNILPSNPRKILQLKIEAEKALHEARMAIQRVLEVAIKVGTQTFSNDNRMQNVSAWLEDQKKFSNKGETNPSEWLQGDVTEERKTNALSSNLSAFWGKTPGYDRALMHAYLEACRPILSTREC